MTKVLNDIILPDILYKYRDFSNISHRDLITKQEIYLSEPNSFNDPFDCKIPTRWDLMTQDDFDERNEKLIDIGKNICFHNNEERKRFSKHLQDNGALWSRENLKKPGKDYFDNISALSGVISLTSKPDNILMWSHYSNSHSGFCIGFDSNVLLQLNCFDFIGKVSYSKLYPIINGAFDLDLRYFLEMFSKSSDWEYEDEYRITKRHMENRLVKLPKKAFKQIVLGCTIKNEDKADLIDLIKNNLPDIHIMQAELKEYEFSLNLREI